MHRSSVLLAVSLFATTAAASAPPVTAKHRVADHYWGTTVHEDYRWLEDWGNSTVREWSGAQNGTARAFLDSLPMRKAVLRRVDALTKTQSPSWVDLTYDGGAWFALKNQPPKQQPLLVRIGSLGDLATERIVLDPNVLDPSGETAIDYFVPSHDGAKVFVSLSKRGSESGTGYVYDARTGKSLGDEIPSANGGTAGGSAAWNADGTGFWHTRYPQKGERKDADLPFYQQVYFHRLGTPAAKDAYVIGRSYPKIAEVALETSDDGAWVLADVRNGDGGDHGFWLARADEAGHGEAAFRRIADFPDRIVFAEFGPGVLYLVSRKDAPAGKVLSLPLPLPANPLAGARTIVPEGKGGIEWLTAAGNRIYVEEIEGGPSRVAIYDKDGARIGGMPIPASSTIGHIEHGAGDLVAVQATTYTRPGWWSTYRPGTKALVSTKLVTTSPAKFADVTVRNVTATSKDGTQVPLTLLVPTGAKLDGTAPVMLTGYGGYGISQRPGFNPARRVWFDQGGILAIAHTRGGGEFGDAWHLAGNLTRKQNVFDDFAACGQYLVDHRIATTRTLACQGGSNGGLLMGAMITQHPELFRAVVTSVGIYDMLRVEASPNGLFNITEFGTVRDSAQFRALYAYSPYHHVVDGTRYPAVLFTTGGQDPRVDPMQSRKMTARLQAANASTHPVLLRTDDKVGHGIGSPLSARNALQADVYSFLFSQLGVKYQEKPPVKPTMQPRPEVASSR